MIKIIQKIARFLVNYDVFISVEESDLQYAKKISEYLRKLGAKVFIYKTSIEGGKKSREVIKQNLKSTNYFITLISKSSISSVDVTLERGGAYFSDIESLQVLLDDVDIKKLGMTDELQYVKYKDKNFYPNLRNMMLKVYLIRTVFWLVIIGIIIYSKLS